jgi:hypothetical protein
MAVVSSAAPASEPALDIPGLRTLLVERGLPHTGNGYAWQPE